MEKSSKQLSDDAQIRARWGTPWNRIGSGHLRGNEIAARNKPLNKMTDWLPSHRRRHRPRHCARVQRARTRRNIAIRKAMIRRLSLSLALFLSFPLFLSTREIRLGRRPRSFDRAKIDPEVLLVNCISEPRHRYALGVRLNAKKRELRITFFQQRLLQRFFKS